jgi:4-amino-4-deoxy-L-arabinose transferase-like glycosyltransferase
MKKKQKPLPAIRAPLLIPVVFLVSFVIFFKSVLYDERYFFYERLAYFISSGAALFFIAACAFGAGDIILKFIKKNHHSKIEHFILSAPLGFGVIIYLVFLIGALDLLEPLYAVIIIAALFLISVNRLRIFFRKAETAIASKPKEVLDIYEISLISILGISFVLYFLKCFAPPLNYDSLAYHLAIPKLFIDAGGIRHIPGNVYSNFPMNMEFLFMLGMLIRDDILARLLHFAAGVLSALAIYSFTSKHFSRKTALTASAAFFGIPYVGLLSGWAFNELLLSLFVILSVFCFSEWAKNRKSENLLLSSIFCGFALGTKYTAFLLLFPFISAGALLVSCRLKEPKKKIVKNFLTAFGVSLLVPVPWFIKNAVYTHNPVYPFLSGLFNRLFSHPAVESFDMARFIGQHTPGSVSLYSIPPLLIKTFTNLQIGPFFAAFLPFIIFAENLKKFETKLLLAYFLSYILLWTFFTHQDPRFLIPALGCFAVPVSSAVILSSESSKNFRGIIQTFIVAVFLSNLALVPFQSAYQNIQKAVWGIYNREEFMAESGLYQYPAFSFINEKLPERAKILFIGENQTYYVDRKVVSNSPFDTNKTVEIVNRSKTAEDIRREFKNMGITHILYNASEVKRTSEAYDAFRWKDKTKEALFLKFITGNEYLEEIFSERGVFIWELD